MDRGHARRRGGDPVRRALFVWVGLSLVGLGCWGIAVVDDDAVGLSSTGSAGGEPVDASDAATSGGLVDGSSQDAAPDGPETCDSPVGGMYTCCSNGKPCRGWCDSDDRCSCGFGIDGGCGAPTVCCGNNSLCTSEEGCNGDGTLYNGPEYDGGTECAPPSDNPPWEDVSCCEGVPCWGKCELHDGAWQCSCYGIPGGCGPFGLTCCGGACTHAEYCGPSD